MWFALFSVATNCKEYNLVSKYELHQYYLGDKKVSTAGNSISDTEVPNFLGTFTCKMIP